MAKVPAPHIGLTKGEVIFHFVASTQAQAKDSCIGAAPGSSLYPCLESNWPEVSKNISALLSIQCKCNTILSFSGPESGRVPYFCFILSTTASFTRTLAYSGVVMVSLCTLEVTEK